MPRLSISSWSLHNLLGRAWYDPGAEGYTNRSDESQQIDLLAVPELIARHGIGSLELCHFHFHTTESPYLRQVRHALESANVELFSVLIDTGDVSSADYASRQNDLDVIRHWIDVAAELGATHVRIIAGDSEVSDAALARSVEALRSLASYAHDRGVATITENFRRLAERPETCLHILDSCDDAVGLCVDFGNFPVATRESDLEVVLPRATSIHAKAEYTDGQIDQAAYERQVRLAANAGFDGPASLIYQDVDDGLPGISHMKAITEGVWHE